MKEPVTPKKIKAVIRLRYNRLQTKEIKELTNLGDSTIQTIVRAGHAVERGDFAQALIEFQAHKSSKLTDKAIEKIYALCDCEEICVDRPSKEELQEVWEKLNRPGEILVQEDECAVKFVDNLFELKVDSKTDLRLRLADIAQKLTEIIDDINDQLDKLNENNN